MATIQLRLDAVNTACCTADAPCADGLPAACNIQCAIIYTKFYDECCAQPTAFSLSSASLRLSSSNSSASNHAVVIRVRLDHLLMGLIDEATNPGASAVFDDFQTDCLSSFDPRSLLDVISSAQCCSGASNGHDLAAANPLSDHSCDANSGGPGATWYQIDEQMTDHASGVAYWTASAPWAPVLGDVAPLTFFWVAPTVAHVRAQLLVCAALHARCVSPLVLTAPGCALCAGTRLLAKHRLGRLHICGTGVRECWLKDAASLELLRKLLSSCTTVQ